MIWECDSVVEYLPSIHKVLDSIPSMRERARQRERQRELENDKEEDSKMVARGKKQKASFL
jgi:hypothetical protein